MNDYRKGICKKKDRRRCPSPSLFFLLNEYMSVVGPTLLRLISTAWPTGTDWRPLFASSSSYQIRRKKRNSGCSSSSSSSSSSCLCLFHHCLNGPRPQIGIFFRTYSIQSGRVYSLFHRFLYCLAAYSHPPGLFLSTTVCDQSKVSTFGFEPKMKIKGP